MKICSKCHSNIIENGVWCNSCKTEYNKFYYQSNKESLKSRAKKFRQENKISIKEKDKIRYQLNKKRKNSQNNKYQKERKKKDIIFKLRKDISTLISRALKQSNSSKNNLSCLQYMSCSFIELKEHIESKFEPWMNWNNQGKYNIKTWDNEDSSTWTWQLDHIIPQSDLPFASLEDENFKKCWSLENLRPYSAKLNILDGTNRIRHKEIK